ncbi:MAG: glycosyltransferase family 2 protein [Okeania sp. SIO3H1]|nr:glycosyltransferase family 2 protein [Okeania sp. SIO3H1]
MSVVIPARNEEEHLQATLDSVMSFAHEVLVVDGGSTDRTAEIARHAGATVLSSPKGRGRQQNLGAAHATGELLLFLHADTLVPPSSADLIRITLSNPAQILGAFSLALSDDRPLYRWVERGVRFRSRFFQLPFGDQAFFLHRDLFVRLGGFPHIPLLEDVHLLQKIRFKGKVVTVDKPVHTSPRRWQRLGVGRTTMVNQAILLANKCGVSPERLARWYGTLS